MHAKMTRLPPSVRRWSRRRFLGLTTSSAAVLTLGLRPLCGAGALSNEERYRAAIIGHTGQGNYGHELDLVFNGRQNIDVCAVADPDPGGLAKAAQRSRARSQYHDYAEMLRKEKPGLVCIAPRWSNEHHAMGMACLRAGAHIYVEKPVTQTLAEADELLALARKHNLKIAVAHQMRLAPNVVAFKDALESGVIGELIEIRTHGKQDSRAGGEDLVVLGVHIFDLLRFFAGPPAWCSARILQAGREVTGNDVHQATEGIGPVVGDEIMAEFAFPAGVQASFTSRARNRERAGAWGMEFIGTKGTFRMEMEMLPRIYRLHATSRSGDTKGWEWRLWEQDPTLNLPVSERGFTAANKRVVDDWLQAIGNDRQPVCSGEAATHALEMAMAVFKAGMTGSRVPFPMQPRTHPLVGL